MIGSDYVDWSQKLFLLYLLVHSTNNSATNSVGPRWGIIYIGRKEEHLVREGVDCYIVSNCLITGTERRW